MNDIELAESIVKRCHDGGYGLVIGEAGLPTLTTPKPDLDPALLTDMAMCPPQAIRAVLIGQSVFEALPTEQPALPMELPPPDPARPVAWTGGKPSGERLSHEERQHIKDLFVAGCSRAEIERITSHGRKTIAAVIAADADLVKQLAESRAARALVEEALLHDERSEAIEKKRAAGKLSVADLNSAIMINGILIKDSGGAAPKRIRLEADPSLVLAAQLFAGTNVSTAAAPVQEAEIIHETTDTTHHSP